ncbi:MAG: hypothetical protein SVM80_05835 [Halobacteriota archaeon]|nr:hypothetical protein [Halobacteriota archaeon]
MRSKYTLAIVTLLVLLLSAGVSSAYEISASTSKIVYTTDEDLSIEGTINYTAGQVDISAIIYDSTDTQKAIVNTTSVGGIFNYSYSLSGLSPEDHYVNVTDGNDSVYMGFEVVSEIVFLEAHLVESKDIVEINTSTTVTTPNAYSGNFSELLSLSKSNVLHYGTKSVGGTTYYFVLVDQHFHSSYDTLYVDDDNEFLLYSDTEDSTGQIEIVLREGDKFKDYIVGHIEFETGETILLGRPVNSSVYDSGSTVNFIVIAKDSNNNLFGNRDIKVDLLYPNKTVISSKNKTTNSSGWFVEDFTAPSVPNVYSISLNDSLGMDHFKVESFKLLAKITDVNDNPTYSFAPDPIVKINLVSKDSSGDPFNLTSNQATIYYPNGTSSTTSLDITSTGTYSYELDLENAPKGQYCVKITGVDGSAQQEVVTGFSIESISVMVESINTDYIDQAEGGGKGMFVNAFAPNSNVTIMVMLSNLSAGGMFAGDPHGVINIDDPATPTDECESRVTIVELTDDRGVSYNITPISGQTRTAFNLTTAGGILGLTGDQAPPPDMMQQCMLLFQAPNRSGVYRIEVKVNYNGEEKYAGDTFGIQRLYAVGDTVDFKGEDFGFFAPNTTVRIKLKVKDLVTDTDLSPENITGAKIIEMHREFPTYSDTLDQVSDETIDNGTISFLAPAEEGFYWMRFRFKANLDGQIEEGLGSAFFQLKKYMIWGYVDSGSEGGGHGPTYVGAGENITLRVNVIEIEKGSMLDLGMTTGLTSTSSDGLIVDVIEIRNDQLMKIIPTNQYSVSKGFVTNSSANVTIIPGSATSLPTGWYGADLLLTDPSDTNNTYFGWAWFEVRNFWVETIPIVNMDGNLTAMWMEPTYQSGSPVTFAVMPRDPRHPDQVLTVNGTPTVKSVTWMVSHPPPKVEFTSTVSKKDVYFEWDPQNPIQMYVVNITGLNNQGYHQANVEVTTDKGSDIGSFWFDLASYNVMAKYRGMEEWPPTFSSSENLTVTFTGLSFDEPPQPHNLNAEGTRLFGVWDEKMGSPVRLDYTVSVNQTYPHICTVEVDLSPLSSGFYHADFTINDTNGKEKETGIFFAIKDMVVAVPSIEQVHIGSSDSSTRELNLENDRDLFDNNLWLNGGDWDPQNLTGNGTYCIRPNGEWMQGECGEEPGTTLVYVHMNNSTLWFGTSPWSGETSPHYGVGENFTLANVTWTVVSADDGGSFRVKLDGNMIGGRAWSHEGDMAYMIVPPAGHSNNSDFYHGYVTNLIQDEHIGDEYRFGEPFNATRDVFVYHNTTHLWITSGTNLSANFTGVAGKAVGEIINDPYGGNWTVKSLSNSRVKLTGLNVLAGTGAYINTSLSKSGTIKIESIREEWLGGWDKESGMQRGMDLNNDSLTNGTAYIAISDSTTAGVYDTFFFSVDNNFTNPVSVSDTNRTNRTFGLNDTLTLLSINPRATSVTLYSTQPGDWAELGNYKVGNNITIPVIVKNPNGTGVPASVSIPNIRLASTGQIQTLSPAPSASITGVGEITVNMSSLGYGAGEYSFELVATTAGGTEGLEEWMWPRATMRAFLLDTELGDGGNINNFVPLPISRYDWENYGEIMDLYSVNETMGNSTVSLAGLLSFDTYDIGSPISEPSGAGGNPVNATIMSDRLFNPQYYFYVSAANESAVWVRLNDSDFNSAGTSAYNTGDQINVEVNGKTYTMHIREVNATYGYVAIGVSGFNASTIESLSTSNPRWKIMVLNLSGTTYQVILANDSTEEYPMAAEWHMDEIASKAWFSTDGNFAGATGVKVGENFTSELYLAKIGPGPWDGLCIGNFSGTGGYRPAIDIRPADNTTSYFKAVNESDIGLDLNMDGVMNKTYYLVAFDDIPDGLQNLTSIMVDDDLQITEQWWSNSTSNEYMDYNGTETGSSEQRSNLPRGIWYESLRFGDNIENVSWELQPEWEITAYDDIDMTSMLLRKSRWSINQTENVTMISRAYHFNQTPIEGANVTIGSVFRMTPFGHSILEEGGNYTVTNVQNVTDSNGYGIVKMSPVGGIWDNGEYRVVLQINNSGNIESTGNWFRIGEQQQGGGGGGGP